MALEHSVLNEQKIVELIKEYWNISVVQVDTQVNRTVIS